MLVQVQRCLVSNFETTRSRSQQVGTQSNNLYFENYSIEMYQYGAILVHEYYKLSLSPGILQNNQKADKMALAYRILLECSW